MRLSIPTPSLFLRVLSSSRLPLLASPYVSLCSIFDYSTSNVVKARQGYIETAYKGRDARKSAKYIAKEAAAKGSEKAAEAWETTKDKAPEAADKRFEKAVDAWKITKEVAVEGAEKALGYAKEEEANKPSVYAVLSHPPLAHSLLLYAWSP